MASSRADRGCARREETFRAVNVVWHASAEASLLAISHSRTASRVAAAVERFARTGEGASKTVRGRPGLYELRAEGYESSSPCSGARSGCGACTASSRSRAATRRQAPVGSHRLAVRGDVARRRTSAGSDRAAEGRVSAHHERDCNGIGGVAAGGCPRDVGRQRHASTASVLPERAGDRGVSGSPAKWRGAGTKWRAPPATCEKPAAPARHENRNTSAHGRRRSRSAGETAC